MAERFHVIISGAGLVGATVALALARHGFSVQLLEQRKFDYQFDPSSPVDLRVSAITPASRSLLQQLGVWSAVAAGRSCSYSRMSVWHSGGSARLEFDAADSLKPDLGEIVENNLLLSAVLGQIEHSPNVTLDCPGKVQQLDQNDASGLLLRLEDGREVSADLLIAAEGRQSPLREMAGFDTMSGDYKQLAIVANVDTERSHENTAWQKFLPTGPLAFLPLSTGQSSIVWSCDRGFAEELLALSDDDFATALGQAIDGRFGVIAAVSERASFPLNWHVAQQWLRGRVLLIGDTAHGVHPLAGQGVNLGFGDVSDLVATLAGQDSAYNHRRLRAFERKRKAETTEAAMMFSAFKSFYGVDQPVVNGLRDLGMGLVDGQLWLKRKIMSRAMNNMA